MAKTLTILISGASRGLGRALAEDLSRRGHDVYGTGRSWKADHGVPSFQTLVMDVTDEISIAAAVREAINRSGRIDVLVNNAGISLSGPVEETPLTAAREVFETNYFGTTRTIQAVLPHMRERAAGTIVNVASAAGKIGIPFQAHYAASKFAVEGLTEALSLELLPLGIRVLLIEPGDVRTSIWDSSRHVAPEKSPYSRMLDRFHAVKRKEMGDAANPAEKVAREIADIIESGTRRLRHPVAGMAGLLLMARKILPDELFLRAIGKHYRI